MCCKNIIWFECGCDNVKQIVEFTAEHFINPRSEYIDMLAGIYWKIDQYGDIHCECISTPWPLDLSAEYFNREAKVYARDFLDGRRSISCGECGENLVIKKI